MNLWERIKMDFKERFLNFETAKGLYLIPAGVVGMYVSIYYQQYVIQAGGFLTALYVFSEGLRKTFVNRIKQEKAQDTLRAKRDARDAGEEPQTLVTSAVPAAEVAAVENQVQSPQ